MALVYATKNGNWSDTTVWNTGTLPVAADIVRPNNFTVTIDISATVTEIRNDASAPAAVGGSFTLNDGVSVTASNGFFGTYVAANPQLLNYSGSGSVILNGKINGANVTNAVAFCVTNNSTGTITINGNVENTGNGNAVSIRNLSSGVIIINGNVIGTRPNLSNINGSLVINGSVITDNATSITNTSGTVTITGNVATNGGTSLTNVSGTVTINGDVSASTVTFLTAITNTGSGIITIIGTLTNNIAGNGGQGNLITNTGSGRINVTGNVAGASIANNCNTNTILNSSTGIITITGNVTANSTNATGTISRSLTVENSGGGTVNVTGTVTGPQALPTLNAINVCNAIRNSGNGTVNIIGNIVGTLGGFNVLTAVANILSGTINITGNATGGSTGLAVANTSTGTINLNGNAIGGTAFQAIEGTLSSGVTIIEKIVFGSNGQSPTRGYIKFKNTVNIGANTVLLTNATTTNLVDINVVPNLQPSVANVRLGVTYSSGSLTGTMNVPPFNAVKAGVPVDNGIGTAALNPQDVWNVLISGLTQSGSIGERLKNVATVETTGTQIASFNV